MLVKVKCPICGESFEEDLVEGEFGKCGGDNLKVKCKNCGFDRFFVRKTVQKSLFPDMEDYVTYDITASLDGIEDWLKNDKLRNLLIDDFGFKKRSLCHASFEGKAVKFDFDGVFMGLFQVVESSELAYPVAVVMDESGYLHIISPEYIRIYV